MQDLNLDLLVQTIKPTIERANYIRDRLPSSHITILNKEILSSLDAIDNMCSAILSTSFNPNSPCAIDLLIEYYNLFSERITENIQKCFQILSDSSSVGSNDYNDLISNTNFSSTSVSFPIESAEKIITSSNLKCSFKSTNSKNSTVSLSSIDFFITVFLPILLSIFQMMHSQYLSDSSSIESANMHTETISQQEQIIDIESEQLRVQEEIANHLHDISISLDKISSDPEFLEDSAPIFQNSKAISPSRE